jgi:hypothetical protein
MERTAVAAPQWGKVGMRYCPVRAVGWQWETGEEPTSLERVAEAAVPPVEAQRMPLVEVERMLLVVAERMPPAEEAVTPPVEGERTPPVEGERTPPVKEEVQVAVMAGAMTEKGVEMMVWAAAQKRTKGEDRKRSPEAAANRCSKRESRKEEALPDCLLNHPQRRQGHHRRHLHCHRHRCRRHGHCHRHRHRHLQLGAEFSLRTTAKKIRTNVQKKYWS